MQKYFETACSALDIEPAKLLQKSRKRPIVMKKQVLAYLLRKNTMLLWKDIGKLIGLNDHSSTIYAARQAKDVQEVVELRLKAEKLINIDKPLKRKTISL